MAPTLSAALAQAAETELGVRFWGRRGTYLQLRFSLLHARSERAAGGLAGAGLLPGERALVALPTGPELLVALFACLRLGVIPAIVPPAREAGRTDYAARIQALAQEVGATAWVGEEPAPEGLGLRSVSVPVLEQASPLTEEAPGDPDAPAVLQFTSGSTATPKAVTLSQRAILANCRQIQAAARIEAGDVMVSWLPLFHDMGFLAAVSSPVALGIELVLSSPRTFLGDPLGWLRAFSEHRGTHCGAPSFAYRYLLDRCARKALPELDLGSWKVACVGAEPIHGPTLRAFAERFAPLGLAPRVLTPCYGLAEATLALTLDPYARAPRSLVVDRGALARGEVVLDAEGQELPSSGVPVEGVELSVHDAAGQPLGEGRVGEVWARSPSLHLGYWGRGREGFTSDGTLRTGDLGVLYEGELFVTGRLKDVIVLRGENYAPAEVEWAAEVAGVRPGRVIAFGRANPRTATEDLVLLAELERDADPLQVGVSLRRAVYERTGLAVNDLELVPRGTLPVTTSGKLRRGEAPALLAARRGEA